MEREEIVMKERQKRRLSQIPNGGQTGRGGSREMFIRKNHDGFRD